MSPDSNLFELPYVIWAGHKRILACLPPRADFGGLPKFHSRPLQPGESQLIPRADWKPINRRSVFPAQTWILDQNGHGSCVGNGSAGALRRARYLAGQSDYPLSPACLYAQINGGQDQGAVISDALTALMQTGTCDFQTVGQDPIYLQQLPAGWQEIAARFRIGAAYHCTDFDSIGSALQLGYIVVYGIMVGNHFVNFDKYGVAGHARGPGNHCMHGDGMALLPDGRWVLDNVNSWNAIWGPFGNGRVYLDEQHFAAGDQPDAFAIQWGIADPKDPHAPPALV